MKTIIKEAGLIDGIVLYTPNKPTLAEMSEAVTSFHNHYFWNDTAIVVLGELQDFPEKDQQELKSMGVPAFQNI